MVILNLPLLPLWTKILTIPRGLLYSGVLIFPSMGAYGLHGSFGNLVIVWLLGLVAFVFRKCDIPVAPVLLAIVLGPLIEQQFRRSMTMSNRDMLIFLERPISAVLLSMVAIGIGFTVINSYRTRFREAKVRGVF